jgi:diguanylate cyclase (GGDEF)-like protein
MSDIDSKVVELGPEQKLATPLTISEPRPHPLSAVAPGELAREDQLTGVGNRRGVEDRLAMEWERSRRYGRPLSVVAIEVKRLTEGTDEGGPSAPDITLRLVANRLVETSRASDFVGRIVGDEFVLICPEADEEAARGVTMKVVNVMAGAHGPDGRAWPIGVSAGWATRSGDQTADELLQHADQALSGAGVTNSGTPGGHPQEPAQQPRPRRNEQDEREAHYKWMERRR